MSKHLLNERPWSVPVAVAEIPETGRRIALAADTHIREAIATVAGVQAVARLEAEFDLTRYGRDGVHVTGSVTATVEHRCVLTLEPMESKIEEAIDLVFVPPSALPSEAGSAEVRTSSEEPPETLRDGVVDLGAVASEFLILGIDPYPCKPGAVFHAPQAKEPATQAKENVADHPFAALAALNKGKSGPGR
jgi:uncharacterized metal-binding protein YceD (DUF177 family)